MIDKNKRVIDLTGYELLQLLSEINREKQENAIPISTEVQDVICIEEAMKITGYARQTLYGLVNTRKIPVIKKDGFRKLHFSRKAILEWLSNKK